MKQIKKPPLFPIKKPQISLFLDHEMSHPSNETWEDEVTNL
jgi:hypothetical protein